MDVDVRTYCANTSLADALKVVSYPGAYSPSLRNKCRLTGTSELLRAKVNSFKTLMY